MNREMRQLLESQGDVVFEPPEGIPILEEAWTLEVIPGSLVEEESNGQKRAYLDGRLGLVDEATANGRLYRRKLMEREIGRLEADMKAKKIYGELDHPGDGKTKLTRASHFVLGASINEKNEIIGRLEFIPGTDNGDTALAIARAGGTLGVSSRGFGSVVPNTKGENVVQEDYRLVTWDIVADPANAGAHPNFVVEHKEEAPKMDLEKLKKDHPELVEAIRREYEPEARTHAREALREEFETQLKESGDTIREEAVEQAKQELLADPDVARSHAVVEQLKDLLGPEIVDEDENKMISRLKDKISDLEGQIAEQDETILAQQEEIEQIGSVAKSMGFKLYLAKELGEDAETVEGILGDVGRFDNIAKLKEAVEKIVEGLEEDEAERTEHQEEVSRLEKKIAALQEERDQALQLGGNFAVRAYIEKRIGQHPRAAKVRKYVVERAPESKGDVDSLIEAYDKDHPVSEDYKRIRRGISRASLTEDLTSPSPQGAGSVMGVPMGEILERSNRI